MTALLALVLALGSVGQPMLGGVATFYRYHEGQAAAGPVLRETLGVHWRGQDVTVCANVCIRVKLTDFCACGERAGKDTLIDLDRRDFAKLGDPAAGVIDVTIEFGAEPTLPPTDTFQPDIAYWLALVR